MPRWKILPNPKTGLGHEDTRYCASRYHFRLSTRHSRMYFWRGPWCCWPAGVLSVFRACCVLGFADLELSPEVSHQSCGSPKPCYQRSVCMFKNKLRWYPQQLGFCELNGRKSCWTCTKVPKHWTVAFHLLEPLISTDTTRLIMWPCYCIRGWTPMLSFDTPSRNPAHLAVFRLISPILTQLNFYAISHRRIHVAPWCFISWCFCTSYAICLSNQRFLKA